MQGQLFYAVSPPVGMQGHLFYVGRPPSRMQGQLFYARRPPAGMQGQLFYVGRPPCRYKIDPFFDECSCIYSLRGVWISTFITVYINNYVNT